MLGYNESNTSAPISPFDVQLNCIEIMKFVYIVQRKRTCSHTESQLTV